jgi:hypothetical protein
MKLKDLFLEVAFEGEDTVDFSDGDENFRATLSRQDNSIVFAPAEESPTGPQATGDTKIETVLTMLKQKFKVLSVRSLEDEKDSDGSEDDPKLKRVYKVIFSPTVNLISVRDYLVELSDTETI